MCAKVPRSVWKGWKVDASMRLCIASSGAILGVLVQGLRPEAKSEAKQSKAKAVRCGAVRLEGVWLVTSISLCCRARAWQQKKH